MNYPREDGTLTHPSYTHEAIAAVAQAVANKTGDRVDVVIIAACARATKRDR